MAGEGNHHLNAAAVWCYAVGLGNEGKLACLFEAGVLLFSATLRKGTSTFASGKYVAAQRRGMS